MVDLMMLVSRSMVLDGERRLARLRNGFAIAALCIVAAGCPAPAMPDTGLDVATDTLRADITASDLASDLASDIPRAETGVDAAVDVIAPTDSGTDTGTADPLDPSRAP